MKYMGSKNRIAKHILPIMETKRKDGQVWVEPFVGGANMIDKVDGVRIGADKNKYLISMFKDLQDGKSFTENITKQLYSSARTEFNNNTTINHSIGEIGWIGWTASFNGRFFDGGYSGGNTKRDYPAEQMRNIKKQLPNVMTVEFSYSCYKNLQIPPNSLVYCDIPYKGTKQYSTSKDFDHEEFWQWCRDMATEGHTVFVSEYEAPSDFKCVWSGELTSFMKPSRAEKKVEKLFTI